MSRRWVAAGVVLTLFAIEYLSAETPLEPPTPVLVLYSPALTHVNPDKAAKHPVGTLSPTRSSSGGKEPPPNYLDAVASAYARLLSGASALPPSQRTYLVVHPGSGLGNKLLTLDSALLLSLLTNRVLLLGDGVSAIIPHLFAPQFRPLMVQDVPELATPSEAPGWKPGGQIGPLGWPVLRDVSKKRSDIAKCVYKAHGVADCLATGGRPAPAVLEMVANQAVDVAWFDGGVLGGPDTATLTSLVGFTPNLVEWRRMAVHALFGSPSPTLSAVVEAVKSRIDWDRVPAKGTPRRVGVHVRLFADIKKKDSAAGMRVDPAFWTCAEQAITAVMGGNSSTKAPPPPGDPPLLIYYATDSPHTRNEAVARLGHLGRVVWSTNSTTFTHTKGNSVSQALPGVVDWYLLGETDAIVGSYFSTFSLTTAYRRGVPYTSCIANKALFYSAPLSPSATAVPPRIGAP